MDNLKKINVSENLLQMKNPRQKTRSNKSAAVSQLKPTTVKELLLQKLKQYKKEKSRKKRDTQPKLIDSQDSSIPSLTTGFLKTAKNYKKSRVSTPIMNHNYGKNELEPQEPYPDWTPTQLSQPASLHQVSPQPEYGNLKNGKKPTYRQLQKNKTMRNVQPKPKNHVKVNIEKKFNVGRNKTQKKVGVFIKSNELRRKIDDDKIDLKKKNIKTVKNYLKTQNLIKYGSYAPNELLREMYSSSKLCGNVFNNSGQSLVHNFMSENY